MEQINRAKKRLQFIYYLFNEQITCRHDMVPKVPTTKETSFYTLKDCNIVPYYRCYDLIEIYSDVDMINYDEFDEFQVETNTYSMNNLPQIRLILNDIFHLAVKNIEIYSTSLVPLLNNKEIKKIIGKHSFRNGHFYFTHQFQESESTSIVTNYELALYSCKIRDHLNNVIYSNETGSYKNKQPVKSFETTLTEPQLKKLFDELIKGNYINPETDLKQLKAIFNAEVIESRKKVKWILLSRKKQPHKTALRELLTLILGKRPEQKIVDVCFTDNLGNPIVLPKPKNNEPSNYYADLEKMIK
ncbi:MAG: hypothetical protein WCH34_01300 [Bacteroidota bacterium]